MASPKSQLSAKEEVGAIQHGLIPNVRNLALSFYVGLADERTMPGTYLFAADVLDGLRKDDSDGWKDVHFKSYPGLGHAYPKGEPADSIQFMFAHERVAAPEVLVWEYAKSPSPEPEVKEPCKRIETNAFYWLRCQKPQDRQWIRATRTKNEIELAYRDTASGARGITLCLDATMIDPKAEIVVKCGKEELYRGKPRPDVWTILESMDERLERSIVFDRRIDL